MVYSGGALPVGVQRMAFISVLSLFMYNIKRAGSLAIGFINLLASDLTIDLQCDYCRSINEATINITEKEKQNVY